jgi:hypothetical protein
MPQMRISRYSVVVPAVARRAPAAASEANAMLSMVTPTSREPCSVCTYSLNVASNRA